MGHRYLLKIWDRRRNLSKISYLNFLFQWYMVTVVHVYNRWSKSELRCYVNGEIVSSADISWLVSTSDVRLTQP